MTLRPLHRLDFDNDMGNLNQSRIFDFELDVTRNSCVVQLPSRPHHPHGSSPTYEREMIILPPACATQYNSTYLSIFIQEWIIKLTECFQQVNADVISHIFELKNFTA